MLTQGEGTFVSDGLELWYKVAGKGPVCVLLTAGWGPSSELYFMTMERLEDFLTMVYMDTRGSGRSEKPPTPHDYTYEHFAADLDALRAHLGQERILVMGHSQGGVHAMQYALMYPQGCAGLILLDTLAAFDQHMQQDMMARVALNQNEPWFEKAHAALMSDEMPASDEAFGEYLMTIIPFYFVDLSVAETYAEAFAATTFSLAARAGQIAVQLELNLLSELHKITAPTLLLVGSDDFICSPLQSERIHFRIKNSKLIVIPESGHFPWMEKPDDFYTRVKGALQLMGLLGTAAPVG